jgi:hypothetical protein
MGFLDRKAIMCGENLPMEPLRGHVSGTGIKLEMFFGDAAVNLPSGGNDMETHQLLMGIGMLIVVVLAASELFPMLAGGRGSLDSYDFSQAKRVERDRRGC